MTQKRTDLGLVEAAIVLVVDANLATWAKAAALSFGMVLPLMPLFRYNYLTLAFILFVLAWVKLRGETWASFGLVVPAKWGRTIGFGLLVLVAQLAFDVLLQPVVEHAVADLTGSGPNKAAQVLGDVRGNFPLFLYTLPCIWVFGAFGEEVFYRGYLMTRFAQFMGEGRLAWGVALVAQAALFGAAHAYQGLPGMVTVGMVGMIYGAGSLVFGRTLWPAMIAHGLADMLGFTLLYFGMLGSGG